VGLGFMFSLAAGGIFRHSGSWVFHLILMGKNAVFFVVLYVGVFRNITQ
jgi:hypothetical protein